MKLTELPIGGTGVVTQVGGTGAAHRHLLDMGLTPGVRVRLLKAAPLGDPLLLTLRGYQLTLRKAEGENITLAEVERP